MIVTLCSFDKFGREIRRIRKGSRGLTQSELAIKAGISVSYVSAIENDKEIPLHVMRSIADALGIRINVAISIGENDFVRLTEIQDDNEQEK